MAHETPSKTIPTNPNNGPRSTMNHGVNMSSYNEVPIYFPTIHPMTVNVDGSREGRMQQTQGFPQQGGNALLMQMASQNTGIINPLYQVQLNNEVMHEEEPFYVNAKQYHRIIKRRHARARLDIIRKALTSGKPYTHESRHRHAMRRPRGAGGRFLTSSEISKMSKEKQESDEKPKEEGSDDSDIKDESLEFVDGKYLGKEDKGESESIVKKSRDTGEKDEGLRNPTTSGSFANTSSGGNVNTNTGSASNQSYISEFDTETKEPNVLDTMQMIVSNDMNVEDSPGSLRSNDRMK